MTPPGPVALAGSGEFTAVMEQVDADLLAGRPRRAAFLPTAAGLEGATRVEYWLELASSHYAAMGVEPVAVPVRDRSDAEDPAMAALVAGAGLIYLSGGDPHHLAATLRATPVWEAILAAWRDGAALAGSSAGAMALTAGAPLGLLARDAVTSPQAWAADGGDGLRVVGELAVIPHFDRVERWRPGAVAGFRRWRPPGTTLLGVEEDTALVGNAGTWRVQGRGSVWLLDTEPPARFPAGAPVPVTARTGS